MSREPADVVEECFAAFADRDVERFLAAMHPDVRWQPANVAYTLAEFGELRYRGHTGVRTWFKAVNELSEYSVERRRMWTEGDHVFVEAVVTLRVGEGPPVASKVVYDFEVHDGRVTELTTRYLGSDALATGRGR